MRLRGSGVAAGIAVGPALLVQPEQVPVFRLRLRPEHVEPEVDRLGFAAAVTREQLKGVRERLERAAGTLHAHIFDAQLLMLDDPMLLERVAGVIREQQVNAEWALHNVEAGLRELFEELGDPWLADRRSDLDDVIRRVMNNLAGHDDAPGLARLPEEVVLVAVDLRPSQAAELDWSRVLAVVTEAGSPTHHTAILARSRGVPAVVGVAGAADRIPPGAVVVVDGTRGEVVLDAGEDTLRLYRARGEEERLESERERETPGLQAETADGHPVLLLANAEFPWEAETARRYGAQGIGLFRSEYLLTRGAWPDEEQQLSIYRGLVEQMSPFPVTVRTWDVGPEELGRGAAPRANPALGERALRLLRRDAEPFRVQIRALLRAGLAGPLRIAFPFIAGPDDLSAALELVDDARRSLERDGLPHRPDVPLGVNIEVPSAALTADLLARRVDFFSVGTNDLIQYLLAVDRSDPRVAPLYQPLHPAVLRALDSLARAAQRSGTPISVCGEMAAWPLHALLLLGLGYGELSMAPASLPRVKGALRRVAWSHTREVARHCLELGSAGDVEAALNAALADAVRPAASLKE